jgi:dipeptidase D
MVTGRRMLNLDSEEDDAIYVGCAGGCDVTLRWSLDVTEVPGDLEVVQLAIGGLPGGHSGLDIHRNRRNAIRLLVELLRRAGGEGLRLLSFSGGSRRNAIPRDASATVAGSPGLLERLTDAASAMGIDGSPNQGAVTLAPAEAAGGSAASAADTQRILATIAALHHGVLAVVPEIAGEILSSNNVATVEAVAEDGKLEVAVACLVRSADAADIDRVARQLEAIGELAGAATSRANEYPGWKPDMDSATLATCRRLYEETFGRPARIAAIHAGLECGIINERLGGVMDVVSFGPTIEGAHSPDERVFVDSVDKIWRYLKAVLAELAKA